MDYFCRHIVSSFTTDKNRTHIEIWRKWWPKSSTNYMFIKNILYSQQWIFRNICWCTVLIKMFTTNSKQLFSTATHYDQTLQMKGTLTCYSSQQQICNNSHKWNVYFVLGQKSVYVRAWFMLLSCLDLSVNSICKNVLGCQKTTFLAPTVILDK